MIFTCNQVHMQAHEERKDFVQNTTRRMEIFLKTRRACPCAVGDVLTLQSKNVFQNSSSRRFYQSSVGMEHAIPYINHIIGGGLRMSKTLHKINDAYPSVNSDGQSSSNRLIIKYAQMLKYERL